MHAIDEIEVDPDPIRAPTAPVRAFGCTTRDLAIAGLALAFAIAFGASMSYPGWTPRLALLLAAMPIGLVALVRGFVRGRPAERWAAVTIGWIVLAGLFSGAARNALFGYVGRDLSALVVVGSLALWALARTVTRRGAVVAVMATVAGMSLSVAVGVAQLVLDVDSGIFAMNGGRPSGLTTNPVYFGGTCVAGLALAVASSATTHRAGWLLPIGWLAMGTMLSGSRVALSAAIVLLAAAAVVHRRAAVAAIGASVVGFAAAFALDAAFGRGSNAVARTVEEAGLDGRRQVWGYALEAVADRPVFGWGFGRFQRAVQGRYSPEFVSKYATQELGQAWFDAHNVLVAVLVAVGVFGLVLIGIWVWSAVRGSTGPALWGVGAMMLTWMLQPASLATLPVAALLLGIAAVSPLDRTSAPPAADEEDHAAPAEAAAEDHRGRSSHVRRRPEPVAAVIGVLLGLGLLVADLNFYRATEAVDAQRTEDAAAWFPGDPVVASVVAQVWAIETGDVVDQRSIEWWQTAAARNPDRPYWWTLLGVRQMIADDLAAADASLDRALDLQPTNYLARQINVRLAIRLEDEDRLRRAVALACEVGAPECETDVDAVVAEFT